MLPNIRLMIAATIAAILMLICGFSMFATFRVSHAPLERVASVASLHLVATDAAAPAMIVTAAAPFNNRFDVGGPGSGSVAALAYAAPEPTEPAADDREPTAAEPATGDGRASSQQAAIAEAEPETKPEEAPAAAAELTPPAVSTIALAVPLIAEIAEPMSEPAAQTREPEVASAPATAEPAPALPDLATQAAEKAEKAEEKKAKRAHAAARTHRIHRTRIVARASGFETQTTFQTATRWTQQELQKAPAKIRHAKISSPISASTKTSTTAASATPTSATATSTTATSATPASATPASATSGDVISGVGGPFVSVPSQ
jgi:hypothetical protein